MEVGIKHRVLAVITTDSKVVLESGGAPIFLVENDEEKERKALLLSRILMGMVHDLENGAFIIVRH